MICEHSNTSIYVTFGVPDGRKFPPKDCGTIAVPNPPPPATYINAAKAWKTRDPYSHSCLR
jgi:hypothetical protein